MVSRNTSDIVYLEDRDVQLPESQPPWRIMIVDDEPSIHSVTRLALDGFSFEGRPLELINAFSAAEACSMLSGHQDIAVILLDVVMETDQAGLEVVRFVREVLRDRRVRIVLRTGQPGLTPERKVIAEYDINDYKEKTDLTAQRLHSLMYSCLRAYRDIQTLESNSQSLRNIASLSNGFATKSGVGAFVISIAQFFTRPTDFTPSFALVQARPEADGSAGAPEVIVATGHFQSLLADANITRLRPQIDFDHIVQNAFSSEPSDYVMAMSSRPSGRRVALLSDMEDGADDPARKIMQGALDGAAIALDEIEARGARDAARDDLILLLSEALRDQIRPAGNIVELTPGVGAADAPFRSLADVTAFVERRGVALARPETAAALKALLAACDPDAPSSADETA
ncbi:MAG: DUF3369 domain-containing protein [Alphaproteobacteria bacterium]|nr:DUF3369 domain-containing protein [Alphaproteobacteria bacterium]